MAEKDMFEQLHPRKFEVLIDGLHRPDWYFLRIHVYENGKKKGTLDLDESWFAMSKLDIHKDWTGLEILKSGGNRWLDSFFEYGEPSLLKYHYVVALVGGWILNDQQITREERTGLIEHDKRCNPKNYSL